MKVNVDQAFKEMDGKVIKDTTMGGQDNFTLKTAAVRALNLPAGKISGDEKMKRFDLARKIYKGGEVDLSVEQWAMVKKCIDEGFDSPLIFAEATEMIEGAIKE